MGKQAGGWLRQNKNEHTALLAVLGWTNCGKISYLREFIKHNRVWWMLDKESEFMVQHHWPNTYYIYLDVMFPFAQ